MSDEIIIGIDAGTSVIKAVAFDRDGRQLAVAGRPNHYHSHADGAVEQDMRRTWEDTAAVLRELSEHVSDLKQRLVAIAVTAQGDGTWLLDADRQPVGDGLLWLDSRSSSISRAISERDDYQRQFSLTGCGVNGCQQSSQLAWLKQHQPERLQQAQVALHCKDWLYFCMTGELASDPSEAVFTFGNFRTRQYEPEILERFGIADYPHLLPPIVDGVQQAHTLNAQAAAQAGLTAGTPVVLGYVDVVCSALGGGLYDGKNLQVGCTIIGSTGMHMKLSPVEAVELNLHRTGYTMSFPLAGYVAQIQSNMAATLNIDWVLDLALDILDEHGLSLQRDDLLRDADATVLATEAGSVLFHPYISAAGERGPIMEPAARASFVGLDSHHRYAHLLRAVFEGLAHAAYDCYHAMGELPAEIRLTGGAARSVALRTIFSALLDRPVRTLNRAEAGAAGAAMIAAVQTGLYPDLPAIARAWVLPTLEMPEYPDAGLATLYARHTPVYRQARQALQPVWQALQQARN
ncbi:MAG: FGGY-family carbohydrate kinase [Thiolinea sp.]